MSFEYQRLWKLLFVALTHRTHSQSLCLFALPCCHVLVCSWSCDFFLFACVCNLNDNQQSTTTTKNGICLSISNIINALSLSTQHILIRAFMVYAAECRMPNTHNMIVVCVFFFFLSFFRCISPHWIFSFIYFLFYVYKPA